MKKNNVLVFCTIMAVLGFISYFGSQKENQVSNDSNSVSTETELLDLPECKSKRALSNLQETIINTGGPVRLIDMTDVYEMPINYEKIGKEYAIDQFNQWQVKLSAERGHKVDVSSQIVTIPEYSDKKRVCIANAITNNGKAKMKYVFEMLDGINTDNSYFANTELLTDKRFAELIEPEFLQLFKNVD